MLKPVSFIRKILVSFRMLLFANIGIRQGFMSRGLRIVKRNGLLSQRKHALQAAIQLRARVDRRRLPP